VFNHTGGLAEPLVELASASACYVSNDSVEHTAVVFVLVQAQIQ
jgi:hypothetical protein